MHWIPGVNEPDKALQLWRERGRIQSQRLQPLDHQEAHNPANQQ